MFERFRKAYGVELRLLVWHWSYPILHLLLMAILLYFSDSWDDHRTALGTLETILGRLAIGMISLVGLFVAGFSASRAERVKAAELEWTLPTGVEVWLGRWLAGVTALLGFLLEPLIVAGMEGPPSSLLAGLPTFVGEAALTLAFTTAGAWWLARRVSLGRWAYPLLAAGWLGFLVGPTILVRHFPYFSLLNFMRQGMMNYHSELWRRLAYGDSFLWFNLFYTGLLLLLLGLLVWHEAARRHRRPSLPGGVMTVGALALVLFAGTNYIAPITASLTSVSSTAPLAPPSDVAALDVEAYDLTLDLSGGDRADFMVTLTVHNQGAVSLRHFELALHPTLEITEAAVPFQQEGTRARFTLSEALGPGERRALQLRYGGPIWETRLEDGLPVAETFIHPRGVRLTPQVAWYPREVGGSAEPSRFHLTIAGNENLHFGANIPAVHPNVFASEDASWVFLVGSPFLVTEQVNGATLITARDDLSGVRPLITTYTEALDHLRRFMPDVPVEGLTIMVLEPGELPQGTPPSDGRAVVAIGRLVLYSIRPASRNFPLVWDALLYDLWRLGQGNLEGEVMGYVREAALFIWTHYGCEGDAACIAQELDRSLQYASEEQRRDHLPSILLDLYQREGEAAIVEILRAFRLHSDAFANMSREELLTWLRETDHAQ